MNSKVWPLFLPCPPAKECPIHQIAPRCDEPLVFFSSLSTRPRSISQRMSTPKSQRKKRYWACGLPGAPFVSREGLLLNLFFSIHFAKDLSDRFFFTSGFYRRRMMKNPLSQRHLSIPGCRKLLASFSRFFPPDALPCTGRALLNLAPPFNTLLLLENLQGLPNGLLLLVERQEEKMPTHFSSLSSIPEKPSLPRSFP